MNVLTSLARIWLLRSFKPFTFTQHKKVLHIEKTPELGLYVHIPFCRSICSFCPNCKEKYTTSKCNEYIDALLQEIELVGSQLKHKKKVTSLYFGGGTPALATDRIKEIIEKIKTYFIITEGIGIELHPNDISEKTLLLLKEAGITKISIGIQSFQNKFLNLLGRASNPNIKEITKILKKVNFETVSMDFIFALPNQTSEDIEKDIEIAFSSGANHVALYPFIHFSFATSKIHVMSKKEKHILLDQLTLYCHKKGYRRDSIWTFSNSTTAHYSSMTRDNFLGFGCSATSLLMDQFKINTFSVDAYCKTVKQMLLPTSLTLEFTKRQRMLYYLFWNAYTMYIDSQKFYKFFGVPLKRVYGLELWIARQLHFIQKEKNGYKMTLKGAFYYHYYENYYTLAYIDKMWGTLRQEAWPKELVLK